jgi:hypothetical protein
VGHPHRPARTGLRQPTAKEATTAVIREHAFGHDVGMTVCADFNPDTHDHVKKRLWLEDDYHSNHFRHHAQRAFKALDLKWDEFNPE